MTRFAHMLSIRQGEGRMASFVIGIMLFTSMGFALGGTSIDALFFARFGVQYLPYMFMGLGVTTMSMSLGVTALLGRYTRSVLYRVLPLLMAIVLVVAYFALFTGFSWLYPVLWLGKEVLNSLIGTLVWGVSGAAFDTRQAKRLFPLFNASRILGSVIGGLTTGVLVRLIGTEGLLLVWAGAMFAAFLLSSAIFSNPSLSALNVPRARRKQRGVIYEIKRGYYFVRTSALLRWVAFAAVLFSVLYFSISLPFSRAASQKYINENDLVSFLGLFNGFSTAAAFLASLFLANRLFSRVGIMACLLALPVIYLLGFGVLAIYPLFAIIVGFRFVQMLWLSGIADPAYQAMFNAVPSERRDQVRAFVDGVPGQAGIFIAGAILLIGEQTLEPHQLYYIGLFAALVCTFVIWRARSGYHDALIDALRVGRPNVFYDEDHASGTFSRDVNAVTAAVNGLYNIEPIIRRASAEILGHFIMPQATQALVDGLQDSDTYVRVASLRSLTLTQATPALLDIAASLQDPDPDVRLEAVSALSALAGFAPGLAFHIIPIVDDPNSRVSTRAATALLKLPQKNTGREKFMRDRAAQFLRSTALTGEADARLDALHALGEWGDAEAFNLIRFEIMEAGASVVIRRVALRSLVLIDPERALPEVIKVLTDHDKSLRSVAAQLAGKIGQPAIKPLLELLKDSSLEEGALLALEQLPALPLQPILDFANQSVQKALEYDHLMRGIQPQVRNEAAALLADALHRRSRQYGVRALRAIGLLGNRDTIALAVENLETSDRAQQATVLETLETMDARSRSIAQPLMRLWEDNAESVIEADWLRLLAENDAWLRACAVYAARRLDLLELDAQLDLIAENDPDLFVRDAAQAVGVFNMDTISALSLMDRILFFKRVPLFTDLSPTDLKQLAGIAEETVFPDGELIAEQGEAGDELFVIVSGEILVSASSDGGPEVELARRKTGEYVGEMSIINRAPRVASLTAIGDVRVLIIDQKSFEELMRERPEVSLGIIRMLSERIKEANLQLEILMHEKETK